MPQSTAVRRSMPPYAAATYIYTAVSCIFAISRRQRSCGLRHGRQFCSQGSFVNRYNPKVTSMPNPERIIRLKTVLQRTGLSRSTLYRKIADGTFPRQLPISINGAGWHVNRWIADPAGYRADEGERAAP